MSRLGFDLLRTCLAGTYLALSWSLLACTPMVARPPGADDALFSAEGYRVDEFDALVPDTLSGARVVDTDEAARLHAQGAAVFIDVLPAPPRPAELPPDTLWLPERRRNIPGSAWLPNVGYGRLSEQQLGYFRRALEAVSGGDPGTPLLFYCRANCWMSWNAARRALAWGYDNVYWYAEGSTGWEAAGLPLRNGRPWVDEIARP